MFLTYLVDLLLCAALGEQIIFRAESHLLLIPVVFAILLVLVLRLFGRSAAQRISLPFFIAYLLLITFSLKADLSALDYWELHGEIVPTLSAENLAGLLIIIICGWLSCSGRLGSPTRTATGKILAGAALLLWGLSAALALHRPAPFFNLTLGEHPLALLVYGSIACRLLMAQGTSAPRALERLEIIVVAGAGTLLILSALYCLSLLTRSICSAPNSALKVNHPFLLYLLAAEDPRFLRHSGVDYHRLRQAIREALEHGEIGRGGSTITMQLAKVCYVGEQKTFLRKWNQIVISWMLEARSTKDEVIRQYLENVPFAPGITGITAAARNLYSQTPETLDPEQSLKLVISIFDPTRYNAAMRTEDSRTRNRKAVVLALAKKWRAVLQHDLSRLSELTSPHPT
ncbi:MAG: transglycosylase domain-containing protein [Oligoflexia bacterium]|nr:transglycosylase domain-containing protein [Oligoflexia bacterium]